MRITKHIVFIFFCFGIIGCGGEATYSKNQSIPKGQWKHESPLTYDFDVESTEVLNDLFFSLKYGTDFGYQNIYVKIVTDYPTQESMEDIISLNLTNGTGSFLGNCHSSTCTIDILLQENFRFKEKGKHTIRIYQNSRDEKLEAVLGGELKLFEKVKS
ncbi:MAG: gliding motility-associated lipoprotein GldH [Saprospiraceae bacterium]|jgi:gliding motility-associated lipoprotein GldH